MLLILMYANEYIYIYICMNRTCLYRYTYYIILYYNIYIYVYIYNIYIGIYIYL